MARNTGIAGILVLSGETAEDEAETAPPEWQPDYVFASLRALHTALTDV